MDTHLQDWFIMDSMPAYVYARASRNLRFTTDFQADNMVVANKMLSAIELNGSFLKMLLVNDRPKNNEEYFWW
ncbi:hypothetical protein VB264_09050 [Arcicella aquatica]|uniref:Uncharacterized protein n=1 Tax=Arcicella aquatica TaxID=217141 RepID=A0ABU5QLJ6_9BACT|nr:hypothetical protein [Arcicella aquatica]MEA5257932.1 hypothetical protein [Arcicella aquatica]